MKTPSSLETVFSLTKVRVLHLNIGISSVSLFYYMKFPSSVYIVTNNYIKVNYITYKTLKIKCLNLSV